MYHTIPIPTMPDPKSALFEQFARVGTVLAAP